MKYVAAIALLTTLTVTAADLPSPVDALRHERLSLLDWGLFLLQRDFQELLVHEREYINVRYDKKYQKFVVKGVFYLDPQEQETVSTKWACYARVHAMKRILGVIDTHRIHIAPGAAERLGTKFSHAAGSLDDLEAAERLGKQLLKLFYIEARLGGDKDWFPFEHDVGCEGELLNSEVSYSGNIEDE